MGPEPRAAPASIDGHSAEFEADVLVSARVLAYFGRHPRYGPDEIPPSSLTQAGISDRLSVSQGALSRVLGHLVESGALEVETGHVRHRNRRVMVYRLTPLGEMLAARVLTSAGARSPES